MPFVFIFHWSWRSGLPPGPLSVLLSVFTCSFLMIILVPACSTLLLLQFGLSTMLIQMASRTLNGFPFCHHHPKLLIRVRVISLKDFFFYITSNNKIAPICSQGPSQALDYTKHILCLRIQVSLSDCFVCTQHPNLISHLPCTFPPRRYCTY